MRNRAAFSLVELLVVLGMIVILIAILMPALGKAREAAIRVKCQANLRSVHQSFYAYAGDHEGRVPLGYRVGTKQFNTMIFSGWSNVYSLFGLLHLEGRMQDGRAFYCPAESNPERSHDTPVNPWPPPARGRAGPGVQGGYASRPIVDWTRGTILRGVEYPKRMPRLDDRELHDKAIFADAVGVPERVTDRHGDGVNVLYANGDVQWNERERIKGPLNRSRTISTDGLYNAEQTRIWEIFDRG